MAVTMNGVSRLLCRPLLSFSPSFGKQNVLGDACTQPLSSSTSTKKPVSLPVPPKKPLTSYFLFASELRPSLTKSNPDLKVTEVAKRIASEWKKLDAAAKERYNKRHQAEMEKYTRENYAFQSKLTPGQRAVMKELQVEKKIKKNQRKLSEKLRLLERPKGARSAFVFYCSTQLKNQSDVNLKDALATLGTKWKSLSPEAKKPFEDQAAADRKRYEAEMDAWRKKLEESGEAEVLDSLQAKVKNLKIQKFGGSSFK